MTALDELMGEFSSFSLMSYDHNAGPKLWSRKASARALQPWRGEVEMGESRTPRPNKRLRRYATDISGGLITRDRPSPARFAHACPVDLDSRYWALAAVTARLR